MTARQLTFPACRRWARAPITRVDRSGAATYVHLIRAPDDPQEKHARGKGTDSRRWSRELADTDAWVVRIRTHMADGVPRTFHRITIELADFGADVAYGLAPDHTLWALVEAGELALTLDAPVLFSAVAQASTAAGTGGGQP